MSTVTQVNVHLKQGRNTVSVRKMTVTQVTDWMVGKYPTYMVIGTKHDLEEGATVRLNMPNKKAHILIKPLA